MALKVGDYVRTKYGYIAKIEKIKDDYIYCDNTLYEEYGDSFNFIINNEENLKRFICKSSPNIIDLIQVGDYVNGAPVLHKENGELVCGLLLRYKEENIKSIVTKEQFEQMEYRIGDDE